MRNSLLIILLLSSFNSIGQIKTGLFGYYGMSVFDHNFEPVRTEESYVTKYRPTFGGGAYLKYSFKEWFAIRISPFIEQLRTFDGFYVTANESYEATAGPLPLDENGELDWWATEYWLKANYVSFPLGFEFQVSKFQFEIGAQYSYMLKIGASSRHMSYALDFDTTNTFQWSEGFYVYDRFNLSVYSLARFNLFENLHLEIRFCQGVNNIFLDYFDARTLTRQFQFGFSYEIWPRDKKKTVIDEAGF